MGLNPLVRKLGSAGESIWRRFPLEARHRPPLRTVGKVIHTLSTRFSERRQSESTWFLRNLPLLYTIQDHVSAFERTKPLRICSIGCSTGAELYSILWMLRKSQPSRGIAPVGIDRSEAVIETARSG